MTSLSTPDRLSDPDPDHLHPHVPDPPISRRTLLRDGLVGLGSVILVACSKRSVRTTTSGLGRSGAPDTTAATLAGFDQFATTVKTFRSGDVWLIESDGMPAHNMMVGIRSWQQQVPTPQPYTGSNAWRIPAVPKLASTPISARSQLYRGAVALAVNGVPIFNALNNRGVDSHLAGELDDWGGHCGRADDYHYHVAPLHLQDVVGAARPIAYALDGFALYGSTEPDGSAMRPLDDLNGHPVAPWGYHYHGTTIYPYLNGGLRGVVNVVGDQVDPQPATTPFRPDGAPLPGASITDFRTTGKSSYSLTYAVGGATSHIDYEIQGATVSFQFTDPTGSTRTEAYTRGAGGPPRPRG